MPLYDIGCWCRREDSNLHGVLNPTRSLVSLPLSPLVPASSVLSPRSTEKGQFQAMVVSSGYRPVISGWVEVGLKVRRNQTDRYSPSSTQQPRPVLKGKAPYPAQ